MEIIVVMIIIGVMTLIAGISLVSSSRNAELRSAAQEMYGQFQRAKMEAIKQNRPVSIVFNTVGTDQYQIFVDSVVDNKILDAGEQLLATVIMKNGIVFSAISFTANSTGFTPKGRVSGGSGSVTITNPVNGKNFTMTTSISGYVHLQ